MKLPAHVLTKLSLAGAIGAVAAVTTCHPAQRTAHQPVVNVVEEESLPLVEIVRESPEPEAFVHFAKPPPSPLPRPVVKKAKPKPQPVVRAHVCGPCGMG